MQLFILILINLYDFVFLGSNSSSDFLLRRLMEQAWPLWYSASGVVCSILGSVLNYGYIALELGQWVLFIQLNIIDFFVWCNLVDARCWSYFQVHLELIDSESLGFSIVFSLVAAFVEFTPIADTTQHTLHVWRETGWPSRRHILHTFYLPSGDNLEAGRQNWRWCDNWTVR